MSYLKQDQPEFNYLRHLVLLYGDAVKPWTKEQLKYYAAHLDPDGHADDWFYDSFLFINPKSKSGTDYVADVNLGKSMAGEGDFFPVCSPTPSDKIDWEELLESYFGEGGSLQTLDETIEELSTSIGSPQHRRNVVLTLPYPHITQESFGALEAGSPNLNFSIKGQNISQATDSRLKSEVWFVEQTVRRWKEERYKNLNLLGVYWIFETVYRSWDVDDHVLLKELKKHVNSKGLKFLWIPFYATYNFHLLESYQDYYFDMAFLQPNFLFYKEGKTIEVASAVAKRCNAGLEMEYYMELDEPIAITNERHIRFREYLNAGLKYGYMNESACAHFQGVGSLERMYSHADPVEREFYDDIYHFVKGTYQIKAYPPPPPRCIFVPRNRAAIAIDLGRTNLRMGVVDESGKILHWKQEEMPSDKQVILDSVVARVAEGLKFCESSGYLPAGIGVSTGGRVNFEKGEVVDSTSLIPGWQNVNIRKVIERTTDIPVVVDNDGNCSAVAEKIFGKAKSVDNFISIILGTGIGGGIYVDGTLLRGQNNFTSEIGHVSVDADGPKCSCGNRGCVELYASGSGLVRWAREKFPPLSGLGARDDLSAKAIGEAALSGDPVAVDLLNKAGEKLGIAVAGFVNIFNPSMIVISGSLAGLGAPYFEAFKRTVRQRAIKPTADTLLIEFSDFNKEAGILGAAASAFENLMPGTTVTIDVNQQNQAETDD
ncbi:MAG: ROK family protein [Bacteroidetes bacterium]|nr:ROK family protein [Bacteroidota bacterium]